MARVFITGSTDWPGPCRSEGAHCEGHEVALHARSRERASAVDDLASRSAGVVVGDLSSAVETRRVADQVNAIGPMDAVIHTRGISSTTGRSATQKAMRPSSRSTPSRPNILTALIERPRRLVYLSSSMHRGGAGSLRDIDWLERVGTRPSLVQRVFSRTSVGNFSPAVIDQAYGTARFRCTDRNGSHTPFWWSVRLVFRPSTRQRKSGRPPKTQLRSRGAAPQACGRPFCIGSICDRMTWTHHSSRTPRPSRRPIGPERLEGLSATGSRGQP